MRKLVTYLAFFAVLGLVTGCASWSKTGKGAAIGGAAGAATGAAVSKSKTKGAVIGGAIGAVAGGIIGSYLDKQAKEMEKVKGAQVERQGDELKVTFSEKILFDFDSSVLKPASQTQLGQVADVLQQYPDTNIMVMGHTDSKGSEEYNLGLSERRADAVEAYLEGRGVPAERMTAKGYGESVPVADNSTEEGRAQNRRVEFSIRVTDQFRQQAEQQGQGQG